MRKKLYQDILTCLKSLTDENGAPLFKTTGLWSGNSETGTPSVAMPAVLMECGESVWKTLGGGSQEALLTLKLHILTAPTEDTSEDTSTEQILNAFELSGRVYTALLSMRIDRTLRTICDELLPLPLSPQKASWTTQTPINYLR